MTLHSLRAQSFSAPSSQPASHPCRYYIAGDTTIGGRSGVAYLLPLRSTIRLRESDRNTVMGNNADAVDTGRLLALNFHSWITGQTFRIRCLDNALGYIMGHKEVRASTGDQIIRWYKKFT